MIVNEVLIITADSSKNAGNDNYLQMEKLQLLVTTHCLKLMKGKTLIKDYKKMALNAKLFPMKLFLNQYTQRDAWGSATNREKKGLKIL